MTERARVQAAENMLRTGFVQLVGGLSVRDLVVPIEEQRSAKNEALFPIENYEFYSIIPTHEAAKAALSTTEPVGEKNLTLDSVGRALLTDSGLPLSANYGIALAYRPAQNYHARVICYSGAGVFSHCGTIFISQLQGRLPAVQQDLYKKALHAGLHWTDTLVSAWTVIARKIGAAGVQIVPSKDIDWMSDTDPELNKKIAAKYDETADRLHFREDELGAWAHMF